jgi:endogenous inhibitor of DNA gyrase (YacG/DUF329 family)
MTARACPICKKPAVADYRPFCSRRCADIDLQRWLTGRYALGEDAGDEPGAAWSENPDEALTDR